MQQKALEQLGVIAGTTEAARTGPQGRAEISCSEEGGAELHLRISLSMFRCQLEFKSAVGHKLR